MKQKPQIISLIGPSATGKTKLAVQIAEKFNGEVISADSRYIYKEINIASAKPTKEEMKNIPHYLIDECFVTDDYSVGKFVKDADKYISDITERNKIPVVAGGTGLYFRALRGTFDIPEVLADYEFRKQSENIPNEDLYNELLRLNPLMAQKIHPNNKVKIVRAIEIAKANVELSSKECPYEILWIYLNAKNREFLYEKANKRVDLMFESGLLNEAEFLFKKYGKNSIILNTIGIKELYDVLFCGGDIDLAKEEIKKNTRHYIKRQISWFNREKDSNIIYIDENDTQVKEQSFDLIEKFLN